LEKPGRDIRAFVLGDQVLASVYRVAQPGKWKTNVAQKAKTEPMQLSTETQELVVKTAKALNLLYAGVDILETAQGVVIAEANASPSWQGIQQATGIKIAESLVKFMIDYMKH
jgi:RimK family alpha-L-glutamate ligase